MSSLRYGAANGLVTLAATPAARRFWQALEAPRDAQAETLERIHEVNRRSSYARRHGLLATHSLDEWRHAAPIIRYPDLAPWIDRIAEGERNVLTGDSVLLFERTSGSSGAAKLIPYTRSLLEDFDRAITPWLFDLYAHRPALWPLASYWSISPLVASGARTRGGVPIGIEDDSQYLSSLARILLGATRLVPSAVRHVTDLDAWRYVTLRFLVASDRLGLVSVWSPSFWGVLCDALEVETERLIRDVRDGRLDAPGLPSVLRVELAARLDPDPRRARTLEGVVQRESRLVASSVWPRLALLSCWTSAASGPGGRALAQRFPNTEIQGKGLLATEGVVSIPLTGHRGAAPALLSHLLEFRPRGTADEETCFVDKLESGEDYEVILTTSGGLFRYAMGDAVRVVGRVARTPLIELVGRVDRVVDLVGEKLSEEFVASSLEEAVRSLALQPAFVMLAPEAGTPPRYALFVELAAATASLDALAARLEAELSANPHYDYARRLGQLGALQAIRVRDGARAYLDGCVALGQRAGDVKPAALHRDTGWRARFELV